MPEVYNLVGTEQEHGIWHNVKGQPDFQEILSMIPDLEERIEQVLDSNTNHRFTNVFQGVPFKLQPHILWNFLSESLRFHHVLSIPEMDWQRVNLGQRYNYFNGNNEKKPEKINDLMTSPPKTDDLIEEDEIISIQHNSISRDLYLENGARFYLDMGHPEFSTPEIPSLRQVAVHDRSKSRYLNQVRQITEVFFQKLGIKGNIVLTRNNVGTNPASFGFHENYMLDSKITNELILNKLVPFFATREIVSGSGKIFSWEMGSSTPSLGFQISQRADYIDVIYSSDTTNRRGLICLARQGQRAHCDSKKYRRYHHIAGDGTMSDYSSIMKIGITQIMFWLLSEGKLDLNFKLLKNPQQVFQAVSRDYQFKNKYQGTLEGIDTDFTAIDIQKLYLETAKKHRSEIPFNNKHELNFVIDQWSRILHGFEYPESEEAKDNDQLLDWRIRLRYQERAIEKIARKILSRYNFSEKVIDPKIFNFERIMGYSRIIRDMKYLGLDKLLVEATSPKKVTENFNIEDWFRKHMIAFTLLENRRLGGPYLPKSRYQELISNLQSEDYNWKNYWVMSYLNQRISNRAIELDIRFNDISPNGIYNKLLADPRSPVKRLEDVEGSPFSNITEEEVDRAMFTPPQDTRAKTRSDFIRYWNHKKNEFYRYHRLRWDGITTHDRAGIVEIIDLAHPHIAEKLPKRYKFKSSN